MLERLRQEAAANRRSPEREAAERLTRSLKRWPADAEEFLERLRELHEKTQPMPLTDELLREAKNEGRA